ncbi:ABC transporter permease [Rhodoligotrophos defluvii]|uniref:ABC transporter permease n=1 Tax=Rhodoligotrophos defluvii TaxID=2561934 RepID=UPI0010C93832|nr:ABC transporter permease [Rhodoligotrophos defluvii]
MSGAGAQPRNAAGPVLLLLAPAVIIYAAFFLWPTVQMLLRSAYVDGTLSLGNYRELLSTPLYGKVIWTTLRFSVITTAVCLVLGYPLAMLLARASGLTRFLLLLAVTTPYWLDYIVRTYSWMVMLGRNGIVNQALVALGLVQVPTSHLSSDFAVLVGMVQVMLPLMVLCLYAGMARIDPALLDAAAAHGASAFAAFRTVFLPLSMPGVIAGSLLTFVNTLGFYITPALLGGPQQTMISQSIDTLASKLLDWPLASALAVVLLVVTVGLLALFNRFFGFERLAGAEP